MLVYEGSNILPLFLRKGYELYILSIHNVQCLLVRPFEQLNLSVLRKQYKQLRELIGKDCVLCLDGINMYAKNKMIAEGISFIIPEQQIYMPFLGIILANKDQRDIPEKKEISYITQKILLSLIYKGWFDKNLTETAASLGVSKMTVTRSYDELKSLGVGVIEAGGKMRRFIWNDSRRALWDKAQHFLRNPVIRQYRLREDFDVTGYKLAGISAICHYSILSDNSCTYYAIPKKNIGTLKIPKEQLLPGGEAPKVILQVLGYDLEYSDNTAIDPLTAILSLNDIEKADPRVETSIEEILEEHLNG